MGKKPHRPSLVARICLYLGTVEDISAILILLFIVGLISLAILMRTTIKFESSSWEEIARFLSLWMYMLGVAIASRENSHLKMSFLEDRIKSIKTKLIMDMIFSMISFLCICVFAWWSIEYLEWSFMTRQKSLVLMISMWVTHISFVVGSVLAVLHMFFHLVQSTKSIFNESERAK